MITDRVIEPGSHNGSRSTFPVSDRARRAAWQAMWCAAMRWSPVPFFAWRRTMLNLWGAHVDAHARVYPSAKVWAPWRLVVDDYATLAPGVEVYNPSEVRLEHHAIVSQDAYLCTASHDYNSPEFTFITAPIRIGAHAWVCARAIVLPGVSVGEGAVLAAGGVASKDLDPWTVYAGNPARAVKKRRRKQGTTIERAIPRS